MSVPTDAGQEIGASGRTLLAERLTLHASIVAASSLLFTIWSYLTWLHEPLQLRPQLPFAAFGLEAILIAMALLARFARLGPRALRALDLIGHLGIGYLLMLLSSSVKVASFGVYESLLGITALLAARALLVPSTPRFTLLVGVAVCAPSAVMILGDAPSFAAPLVTAPTLRWIFIGRAALIIVFSALGSATLYRLRRQVREARKLGQYTLEERLGAGGMGVVYRARHAMLRRPTAVKLLTNANGHGLERFEREAQLTANLTHPNSIVVHDYGRTADGVLYYAMEYLDGIDLEQLVELDGPQPAGRVIHLMKQACGALAEAHAAGLVHRDIKPGNLFLCRRANDPDFVKVLDFGLVKHLQSVDLEAADAIVGTPDYMAPEVFASPPQVSAASDLYALGAVAYRLLTGQRVFDGKSVVEICAHHLYTKPVPPGLRVDPPPPPLLEAVVLRCLAKDPRNRYASADELAKDLEACNVPWTRADAEAWWLESAARIEAARACRRKVPTGGEKSILVDRKESRLPLATTRLAVGAS